MNIRAMGFLAISLLTSPLDAETVRADSSYPTLVTVLQHVSQETGIEFQLSPELHDDPIIQTSHLLKSRQDVESLLSGYNYGGTITTDQQFEKIIISGRNGSRKTIKPKRGDQGVPTTHLWEEVPATVELPKKYCQLRAGSVREITLPIKRLHGMKLGERIPLELPLGQFNVIHDNRFTHDNGDITWVGSLEGAGLGYRAVITSGKQGSFGQLVAPGGAYNIDLEAGRQWLIDLSASGMQPGSLENDGLQPPINPRLAEAANRMAVDDAPAMASVAAPQIMTENANSRTQNVTVDILVLYTEGLGVATAETRLNYLVDKTNQAYIDSQIGMNLRMVASKMVNYTENNDNVSALNALSQGRGEFANVATLKKQYGADLVSLIRHFHRTAQGNCGTSWVNGAYGGPLEPSLGYSVVSDGMDGLWYCVDLSFAHELGHNMGSVHDFGHSDFPGKYPYSYGYGANGYFGTVMSYFDPLLGIFSNPNLDCNGRPCGIEGSADNARSLNQTASNIASFSDPPPKPTPVLPPKPVTEPLKPDLAVAIRVNKKKLKLGEYLKFRIIAKNLGGLRAREVRLSSTFTPNTTLVSIPKSCQFQADRLICQIGTLKPRKRVSVVIKAQAADFGPLQCSVQIQSEDGDSNPANDRASNSATVN